MPKDQNWSENTEPPLLEGERLDELGRKGYRIIQHTKTFCFGIDAVLLADFARIRRRDRVLDLGCGNGILPLLLAARDKGASFVGVEIQPRQAALARRNMALNGLAGRCRILEADLKEISGTLEPASFDAVVTNPPYMKRGSGLVNPEGAKALARHEITCELSDVLREAAAMLRPGGSLFLVYRCWRMAELLGELPRHGLLAKRLRVVYSRRETEGELVLLEARKGGAEGVKVLPPLIIYDAPGVYSEEIRRIYREDAVMSKEEAVGAAEEGLGEGRLAEKEAPGEEKA